MYLSTGHNLGFVHIPKTGGTSIKKALSPILDAGQVDFLEWGEESVVKSFDPEMQDERTIENGYPHDPYPRRLPKHKDWTLFASVRNPWERLLSYYRRKSRLKYHKYVGRSFEYFVTNLRQFPRLHWRPQSEFIVNPDTGKVSVDRVLRNETLERDFNALMADLGLDVRLQKHRYKYEGQYDYREFYTPRMLKFAEPFVSQDAERFGYRFEQRECVSP